jgi:hypothetical protein
MAMRLIDEGARQEAGIGRPQSSTGIRGTTAADRRKARKQPGMSVDGTKFELHVCGLESFGVGMRSSFQAKHLDMAVASKGHAENVRSILFDQRCRSYVGRSSGARR